MIEIIAPSLLFTFACFGALVSRMCGGGKPALPKMVKTALYALPHGAVGFIATTGWWHLAALLSFGIAWAAKSTGHGQYFDLGTSPVGKPEKIDPIVDLFVGPDKQPSEWRDYVGMCVSGGLIALGSFCVLVATAHLMLAALILVGGVFKGAAYEIGVRLEKDIKIRYNEIGECLTGFVDTFCAGVVIWALLAG